MGQLVIFVMDTERGKPAADVDVTVSVAQAVGDPGEPRSVRTGHDGCATLEISHAGGPAVTGCRVELATGAHFQAVGKSSTFPVTCIEFAWDGQGKMVLPVLVSAHGYTTYRGY